MVVFETKHELLEQRKYLVVKKADLRQVIYSTEILIQEKEGMPVHQMKNFKQSLRGRRKNSRTMPHSLNISMTS